jgi:hypothetical protein
MSRAQKVICTRQMTAGCIPVFKTITHLEELLQGHHAEISQGDMLRSIHQKERHHEDMYSL